MSRQSVNKVVLIIDDDGLFCDSTRECLTRDGIEVLTALTGSLGLEICARQRVDVVLLDQNLPDALGHELCPKILGYNDQTKIVFITAQPSFDVAVKAIRVGAFDYLSKPFLLEELSLTIEHALKTLDLELVAGVEKYKRARDGEETILIGREGGLSHVARFIEVAADEPAPVLITGETGSGKNVVAQAIHFQGKGKKEAFISINCAAFPESLIESELFGHQRGAFTGAVTCKRGIFEMAEGGTLFLDEIGEMPIHLQSKLLSVLEDKKIRRIGGEAIIPVNVRVIAATSKELEKELDKTFRSDLYYRLSVLRIHIPPLRERRQDIPALCRFLVERAKHNGRNIQLEEREIDKLLLYNWPGNVRELNNILERAIILRKGVTITPSELIDLPGVFEPTPERSSKEAVSGQPCLEAMLPLEEMEKKYIQYSLAQHAGNYTQTAKTLNIALSTLKRKVKEYRLS